MSKESTELERVRISLMGLNDCIEKLGGEIEVLKVERDRVGGQYKTLLEESKKEVVVPITYAGELLRDTWWMLDRFPDTPFTEGKTMSDVEYYNKLRDKVVRLGIIKQ